MKRVSGLFWFCCILAGCQMRYGHLPRSIFRSHSPESQVKARTEKPTPANRVVPVSQGVVEGLPDTIPRWPLVEIQSIRNTPVQSAQTSPISHFPVEKSDDSLSRKNQNYKVRKVESKILFGFTVLLQVLLLFPWEISLLIQFMVGIVYLVAAIGLGAWLYRRIPIKNRRVPEHIARRRRIGGLMLLLSSLSFFLGIVLLYEFGFDLLGVIFVTLSGIAWWVSIIILLGSLFFYRR